MPVFRTPDGRIIEEKTGGPATTGTRPDTAESSGRSGTGYDDPTLVRRPGADGDEGTGRPPVRADEEPTRLAGAIPGGATSEDETDPVSGWFVVLEGPGKGQDVRIGMGRNDLGREPGSNRVALPFGDSLISRKAHLWITYDPRHRVFSVSPGDSSPNLAYLDGAAIDARMPLGHGATITIGATTLRFVAFCGEGFDWTDAA